MNMTRKLGMILVGSRLFVVPLQVYHAEAKPVEEVFRKAGVLKDFKITGGIPETFPRLLAALKAGGSITEEKQAA